MTGSSVEPVGCETTPEADWGPDVIGQFANYQRARGFSENTVTRRTLTLEAFSRLIAPAHLGAATLNDIDEFLAVKPSPRTRHAYRSDLRVFYGWAVRRGMLETNPAELIEPIRVPKSVPRPIGPEVHAALAAGTLRVRRMMALGLYAGLRCAEIAALDASDIHLQEPPVIVVRNGKGGKDRVVPMHPDLVAVFDGLPSAGPVFPFNGRPVKAASVSRTLRRHFAECGLKATAHQLRHTFGTEAARATNGNLLKVGLWMGHADTNTTKGYAGWAGDGAADIARMFTADVA